MSFKGLKDALAGKNAHVLLSRMGPYKLFYWDIARTAPNQELESEVSCIFKFNESFVYLSCIKIISREMLKIMLFNFLNILVMYLYKLIIYLSLRWSMCTTKVLYINSFEMTHMGEKGLKIEGKRKRGCYFPFVFFLNGLYFNDFIIWFYISDYVNVCGPF